MIIAKYHVLPLCPHSDSVSRVSLALLHKHNVKRSTINDNVSRHVIAVRRSEMCVEIRAERARAAAPRWAGGYYTPRAGDGEAPRCECERAHSPKTLTHHRAHILAGANCKRWPAHMDMHEDTAPPHAAVSTCPICNAEQTDRRFGLTCSSLFCNSACAPSAAYSHLGALRRHERWSRAIPKHLSGVSLRRVQDDSLLR